MAVQLKSRFETFARGVDRAGHELVMGLKAVALPIAIAGLVYAIAMAVVIWSITTASERDLLLESTTACGLKALGDGGRRLSIFPVQQDGTLGPEITIPIRRADGSSGQARPTAREACSVLSRAIGLWFLARLLLALTVATSAGGIVFVRIVARLHAKGAELGVDKFLRGARLVPVDHVIKLIREGPKGAGQYTLASIPIEDGMEMRNIATTGSQGVGKSVAIMDLIDQLRARGARMVIYDKTGEFTERYYRAGKDVLLNPFDVRFANGSWNVFAEMTERPHFRMVAQALIQGSETGNDRFWIESAQTVFADICVRLKELGKTSTEDLYNMAALSSNEELFEFLNGLPAAVYVNPASEKQTQGVRATLSQGVEILRYMPTHGAPFSIREWVHNEHQNSCLFITSRADIHAAVMPIFTVFVEIAIIAAMGLRPTQKDRLWIILDELASMKKVPSLAQGLTEGRKFGVPFVVGFQNEAQLVRLYGKEMAREIMANLQHQFVMRVGDGETARIYSEMLGRQEIDEQSASLSFGAESVKDGSSISSRRAEIPIVMAAEIQNLPDLTGYFKHAGAYPVCKVDLRCLLGKHKTRPVVAPDYVPRQDLEVKALPRSRHTAIPHIPEDAAAVTGANPAPDPTVEARDPACATDSADPTRVDIPSGSLPDSKTRKPVRRGLRAIDLSRQ